VNGKPDRLAACGACGHERPVTNFMRRDPHQQFKAKPREAMDQFYCGCQNDDNDDEWPPRERFL
jgi:hypothetical protein